MNGFSFTVWSTLYITQDFKNMIWLVGWDWMVSLVVQNKFVKKLYMKSMERCKLVQLDAYLLWET